MHANYPEHEYGYWTRVFIKAADLLHEKPDLTGDAAYWLARKYVEQEEFEKKSLPLPGIMPDPS